MISLQNLTKRFGSQTAVDALSLEIPAGQIVGFLGPNGAGKSTTLKMLTGILAPTSGTATICGFDLLKDTIEVKRRVGFVPESGAVFESLTGLEYLEMVAALYAIPSEAARARIRQFIAFFDLSFETLTDKLLGAYSKGMRRKVVITAALLHNPPVVFFDEPLDCLDANAAVGFKALIQTLAREGKTIVYSSHILDVVERVCDRVVIIDKGRLLLDGRPDELVASHASGTLEKLFTQLTGGTELEQRAQDFPAMNGPPPIPASPPLPPLASPQKALHKLFLTLFLRGRSSRGLRKQGAPQSVGSKLGLVLLIYAGVGLVALAFVGQPVFAMSLYLHAMTLVFLGMFMAGLLRGSALQQRGIRHPAAPPRDPSRAVMGQDWRAGEGVAVAGGRVLTGRFLRRHRSQRWRLAFSPGPRHFHRSGGVVLRRERRGGLSTLPALVRARTTRWPDDHGPSHRGNRRGARRADTATDRALQRTFEFQLPFLVGLPAASGLVCRFG